MALDAATLLTGARLRVETTLGTYELDIGDELRAEQGPMTRFLRPRVSLRSSSGVEVFSVAPAGDPAEAPPWGVLIGLFVALSAALLLWRMFR
jgi:hypothetical protein